MIGSTRVSWSHAISDAASSSKLAGMKQLHEHFIDAEVVVSVPKEWNSDEDKASINEINGELHLNSLACSIPAILHILPFFGYNWRCQVFLLRY